MDNNENKNQETELEEVKTEEAVETAEKAVDNADEVEEAQIEKEPVLSFEYDVKMHKTARSILRTIYKLPGIYRKALATSS